MQVLAMRDCFRKYLPWSDSSVISVTTSLILRHDISGSQSVPNARIGTVSSLHRFVLVAAQCRSCVVRVGSAICMGFEQWSWNGGGFRVFVADVRHFDVVQVGVRWPEKSIFLLSYRSQRLGFPSPGSQARAVGRSRLVTSTTKCLAYCPDAKAKIRKYPPE